MDAPYDLWYTVLFAVVHILGPLHGGVLPCQEADSGQACPERICPNTSVVFRCIVPVDHPQRGYTVWVLPRGSCGEKNTITLGQGYECNSDNIGSGRCGAFLASNQRVPSGNECLNSSITVTVRETMDDSIVACNVTSGQAQSHTTVGYAIVKVVAPPQEPYLSVSAMSPSELKAEWRTMEAGGTKVSYSVAISDLNKTISFSPEETMTHTFSELYSNKLYTITTMAVNCAGSVTIAKRSWTLAYPPNNETMKTVLIYDQNSRIQQLEITWESAKNGVSQYNISLSSDISAINALHNCSASVCFFRYDAIDQLMAASDRLSIGLRSVNGGGVPGYPSVITVAIAMVSWLRTQRNGTSVTCTFLDNRSYYCQVCCSSSDTGYVAPFPSFLYHVSSVAGEKVTVDLQNLSSAAALYHCRVSASLSAHGSCTDPPLGGIQVAIDWRDGQDTPSPSRPSATTSSLQDSVLNEPWFWGLSASSSAILISIFVTSLVISILFIKKRHKGALESPAQASKSSYLAPPMSDMYDMVANKGNGQHDSSLITPIYDFIQTKPTNTYQEIESLSISTQAGSHNIRSNCSGTEETSQIHTYAVLEHI